MKKKKKNWFLEHVRPDLGWVEDKEHGKEDLKWNSIGSAWKNVKDHARIGIKFKWRF